MIAPLVPGKVEDAGRSGADSRLFVVAVLWIVRVGAPWCDLPEDFGNCNSVFQCFRRWVKAGVFGQIFEALSDNADFEYVRVREGRSVLYVSIDEAGDQVTVKVVNIPALKWPGSLQSRT